jgi:hypothetical protein
LFPGRPVAKATGFFLFLRIAGIILEDIVVDSVIELGRGIAYLFLFVKQRALIAPGLIYKLKGIYLRMGRIAGGAGFLNQLGNGMNTIGTVLPASLAFLARGSR